MKRFFETYYAPNNAVVVVTGNVDAQQAVGWIRKYFGPIKADYLTGYVGRVRAVTPAKVQEMAKKYIDDTKATIVVVGDKKAIEIQVSEFGPVR